jgi:hypothetical protein
VEVVALVPFLEVDAEPYRNPFLLAKAAASS